MARTASGVRPAQRRPTLLGAGRYGRRHNLPAELSSFVGRAHELAQLSELLGSTRLVTLTGPSAQACAGQCCGSGEVCVSNLICCPSARANPGRTACCAPGFVSCGSGTLWCDTGSGFTCCNGACVRLATDVANCGTCGTACPTGSACCNGSCADLSSDSLNCGACGNVCPNGHRCHKGKCKHN